MKAVAVIALTFFATSVFAAKSDLSVVNVQPIINNTVPTPDDTSDDIIIPVVPNDESVPSTTNKNDDRIAPPVTNDTPDDLDDVDDDSDTIDDELEDTPHENPDDSITTPNDNKPLQF